MNFNKMKLNAITIFVKLRRDNYMFLFFKIYVFYVFKGPIFLITVM